MSNEENTQNLIAPLPIEDVVVVSEWEFRHPHGCLHLQWDDIDMSGRSRKDMGDLESVANSVKKNGLIHPPTVTIAPEGHPKPYILVAGERRCRSMRMLEVPYFPVNVRDNMPAHEILELELMENFHRKGMLWHENCVLIDKTHRMKVLQASMDSKSWGGRETGVLMQVSNAHVSHAQVVRPLLDAGDPEILAAPSLFAAYEILLKRREDEAAALHVQHLNVKASDLVKASGGIRQTVDDVDDIFGDVKNADAKDFGEAGVDEFLGKAITTKKLSLELTSLFRLGDCLEIMPTLPDEFVDHIVTDPPYGIDMANLAELKNIQTVEATHDVEQNISMFEPFLLNAFRLVKPNGYVCFWYDLDHHEKLQAIAKRIGFKVQPWPLIWHKLHPCKNASPRIHFTKNFECVMVLRKTSNAALVNPQTSSIFSADGQPDRKLYDNPFAKPLAAWKFLLSAISYQGQTIYDPYAGQMSCARACVNMGLIPMGAEVDPDHYNKGIVQLTKLIKEING